ncbi:MAG: hypothetical protein H5T34_01060 [Candidatus Methanomethyliales bacterium]|nr:hypothetical protein [Candidatus Methanomethylicales archaeon]
MNISEKDLIRIITYARAHCEDRCPADRDPEICLALIEHCRELDLEPPACVQEMGGFVKSYFLAKIREVEQRKGKPIREVLREYELLGVRTLEDDIDRMEADFALRAIKAIDKRAGEKLERVQERE